MKHDFGIVQDRTFTLTHSSDLLGGVLPSRPIRFLRMAMFLIGLIALAACDGAESRNMIAVESPNALEIELGESQFEEGSQRSINVVDPSRSGRPTVSPSRVTWSTSDAAVASVDGGVLHARGIGQARITASSGSTRSSVSVSVVRTPSELLIGQEGSFEGEVGQTLDWPLEAQVVNSHGRPIQGVEVRFKVTSGSGAVSPVIVTTDQDGMARSEWTLGGIAGEQTVTAEALDTQLEPRTVVAAASPGPAHEVLVTPAEVTLRPGSAFQFTADVVDVFGNVVGDTEVTWRSTNPEIAAIGNDGWVTGLQSGQASVEADPVAGSSSESQALMAELSASANRGNGKAKVQVQSTDGGSDAVIAVMGGNHQIGPVGEMLPEALEIQITDGAGRPLRQTDVNWVLDYGSGSLSAASGRTDGQGRASVSLSLGTIPGQLKVTADIGDLGSAAFFATAEAGSLAEIRVSPDSASVEVGAEHSFQIAAFDEYGNPLSDHPAPSWTVASSTVASVNSSGRARGEGAGNTQVRASIEGVTAHAQIQVTSTSDGGDTGGTDDGGDTGGTDDGTTGGTDDGGDDTTHTVTDPAKVTDLEVTGSTETTATVRFTQVDDGTGAPAQYHVRWHLHPIEWGWGQATPASGSCEDPITGDQIGASLTCTVEGLNPDTKYDVQLIAFRKTDGSRVFSPLSNVATGMTSTSSDDSGSGDDGASVAMLEASQGSVSFTALDESVTLSAESLDETGQPVSGVSIEWTSSNQGVATVNQSGTIVAKAIGTALVVVSTTCCDTAIADTVTVSVDQVPASVTVDPSSVSLEVGASQQLVASVNDSNNYKIDGTSVTWSSSDPNVVEVSDDGHITGKGAGSATVIVRHDEHESASAIEVANDSSGGDEGSTGAPTPIYDEDFSGYSSVGDYLNTLNHRGWVKQESRIAFDSDGFGDSSQSIRYDFPNMSGDVANRCNNTTIGYTVDLRPMVEDEYTELQDVWIEVWYRFSPNWNPSPAPEWECSPASADYKMVFGQTLPGNGYRFSFRQGWYGDAFTFDYTGAHTNNHFPGASEQWDGEWYRLRMRMKVSSVAGVADGGIQAWIGDEQILDQMGIEVDQTLIYGVALGRNRNHGASDNMSVSFGRLTVWNDNPGW